MLFLRVELDAARSAKSGVDAEFGQNYELQKQPDDDESANPIYFTHYYFSVGKPVLTHSDVPP